MNTSDSDRPDATATSRPELWLRECLYMMEPMARMMVANGVTYPMFAQSLKRVFLEAAEQELKEHGRKITDSALSLLSGVHRKDVRTLNVEQHQPLGRATSIATEVVARWLSDEAYVDEEGNPLALNIRARTDGTRDQPSFDRLAKSISKDFHARSVLDELERLGIVVVDGQQVRLVIESVPGQRNVHDTLRITAANVRDHLAAGSGNLAALRSDTRPPFLEYAMWSTELSEPSAMELARFTAKAWFSVMNKTSKFAATLEERDRADPARATCRLRFGAYAFYEDTVAASRTPPARGQSG